MSFRPNVHDELTLNGITYRIAEHPAAPGIPYGQEGRAGIVYQLLPSPTGRGVGGEGAMALKVFRARFRTPALVSQAEKLAAFADLPDLPGLTVCRRTVLTPQRNADLLRREPDLTYAVLMPWIEGPTWVEVMLEKRPLTPQQALDLARAFADILSRMEQNGIAHGDLSGPNVLLPMLAGQTADRRPQTAYSPSSTVELVDVEGLYAPGLPRPEALPSGSSGYAHRTAREGLWGPTADRFAGAVLLAEMLGWSDESVREACYGETYFDPAEMPAQGGSNPPRYRTLLSALARHYGQPVADLFERAWTSETLADCPTFGEWLVALPESVSSVQSSVFSDQSSEGNEQTGDQESSITAIRALMQAARRLEEQNKLESALEVYRQALELAQSAPSLRSLAREIELTVQDVEKRVAAQASRPQPAVEIPAPPSVSPLSLGEGPELREQPRRKPGWGFWLLWVLASTAGWAVGLAVGNAVLNAVGDAVGDAVVEAVVEAVVGAVVGVAQWLILRRQVRRADWWILASTAGWAVGWAVGGAVAGAVVGAVVGAVGSAVRFAVLLAVGDAVGGAVAGAVAGVAQWLLLRRQVRRAGWWILASAAGWAVGEAVGLAVDWDMSRAVSSAVIGAMIGIITGAVLVWLLRQPRREEERKSQPE
jgi:hypothetical protein